MQTENRLFDDFARMASGALSSLNGLREEIEARVRERFERLLTEFDLVTREEFEAVKEMAARARAEQEELAARLAALEGRQQAGDAEPTARKRADASPRRRTTATTATADAGAGPGRGRRGGGRRRQAAPEAEGGDGGTGGGAPPVTPEV